MPKKHPYLTGLDIGSHETRCLVAIEEGSRLRFISYGVAPSRGIARGVIADAEYVLESVQTAIAEAERNGGMLVEAAVVGVGGAHVRTNFTHSYVALEEGHVEVHQSDIDNAVKKAAQVPLSDDRTVLQVVPLEFAVGKDAGIKNPLGLPAERIDAHVQVVSASAQAHGQIHAVVNRAGVVVEETIFEGFAAAHAALEEQERDMGVALIDIGAESTELIAYVDDELRVAVGIGIGGNVFAADVAEVLETTLEAARLLIEQYGCAISEGTPDNVHVEVPNRNDDASIRRPRRLLNEVIEARAEELFEMVGSELMRAGLDNSIIGGLVVTGGVSALAGLCDVGERVLGVETRIGLPPRLEDLPDELDHPGWVCAAGLVFYAQRLRLHQLRRRDRVSDWLKSLMD